MVEEIIGAIGVGIGLCWLFSDDKKERKREKKRQKRIAAERQRQTAERQKQLEEMKQAEIKKLERIKQEADRQDIQNEEAQQINEVIHIIESRSLSPTLQQLTDERIANADGNIEELQRIRREVFCASLIEEDNAKREQQKQQEIYEMLEEAYRNRDFRTLQAIRLGEQTT